MTDLFEDKAQDFDTNDLATQLSSGIGGSILKRINLSGDMQVMDFGAGTGLITAHVVPHVQSVTAVDISKAMLEKLASKPELQGKVEIVCQDITDQPLEREFDLIVSAMAMHHVENTDNLFQRFAEHLKSGAKVALADLDKEEGTFHPADIEGVFHHGFEREELQVLLEKHGFDDIEFDTATVVNKEGRDYPIFLVTASKH